MKQSYIFLFFCLLTTTLFSQKEKVQAAYLLQFTKYIQWCPDLSSGDFVIGVLGDSPVFSELTTIAQTKKVGSQPIVAKKLSSVNEISKCNIVFISESKSSQLDAVKGKIGSDCTLIIAEKEGMAKSGAAIGFIEAGGKIGFELNKAGFTSHSLLVNSSLVNLAKAVY